MVAFKVAIDPLVVCSRCFIELCSTAHDVIFKRLTDAEGICAWCHEPLQEEEE